MVGDFGEPLSFQNTLFYWLTGQQTNDQKKETQGIPKAKSVDQSQPTSSEHANYYAARPEIGHCKYMSKKTIVFWAIALFHAAAMLSSTRTNAFFFCPSKLVFKFLRGWTGKMFCVYAKQPLRDKSL